MAEKCYNWTPKTKPWAHLVSSSDDHWQGDTSDGDSRGPEQPLPAYTLWETKTEEQSEQVCSFKPNHVHWIPTGRRGSSGVVTLSVYTGIIHQWYLHTFYTGLKTCNLLLTRGVKRSFNFCVRNSAVKVRQFPFEKTKQNKKKLGVSFPPVSGQAISNPDDYY